MKTTLVILIMAALCLPVPTVQATSETIQTEITASTNGTAAVLIGAGTLKSKNGNCFTVRSDDGHEYFAEVVGSYIVGDYVYHSDPVNGWVDILGHAD